MKFKKLIFTSLVVLFLSGSAFGRCACVVGIGAATCTKLNEDWIRITDNHNLREEYQLGTCVVEEGFHGGGNPSPLPACKRKTAQHIRVARYINGDRVGAYHVLKDTYKKPGTGEKFSCTTGG